MRSGPSPGTRKKARRARDILVVRMQIRPSIVAAFALASSLGLRHRRANRHVRRVARSSRHPVLHKRNDGRGGRAESPDPGGAASACLRWTAWLSQVGAGRAGRAGGVTDAGVFRDKPSVRTHQRGKPAGVVLQRPAGRGMGERSRFTGARRAGSPTGRRLLYARSKARQQAAVRAQPTVPGVSPEQLHGQRARHPRHEHAAAVRRPE